MAHIMWLSVNTNRTAAYTHTHTQACALVHQLDGFYGCASMHPNGRTIHWYRIKSANDGFPIRSWPLRMHRINACIWVYVFGVYVFCLSEMVCVVCVYVTGYGARYIYHCVTLGREAEAVYATDRNGIPLFATPDIIRNNAFGHIVCINVILIAFVWKMKPE